MIPENSGQWLPVRGRDRREIFEVAVTFHFGTVLNYSRVWTFQNSWDAGTLKTQLPPATKQSMHMENNGLHLPGKIIFLWQTFFLLEEFLLTGSVVIGICVIQQGINTENVQHELWNETSPHHRVLIVRHKARSFILLKPSHWNLGLIMLNMSIFCDN